MTSRLGQQARIGLFALIFLCAWIVTPFGVIAAPYAAYVMDARTGETIYARNADTPLHPASLTKMMTLYIAFQAIERGEVNLDTVITIVQEAADEPPSKLGLRAGQQIRLRYLIRAAAIKSANDAAASIGIGLSGSTEAFARRMNQTARAMGMTNSSFRNANGLTASGHLSSAHDMSILGRHLIYDFPQYYNLFSRRTADAGMAQVNNTNRRFLDSYQGADGIKTGFTNAAGYNLTASAQRGNVRIIATVFGGTSTANRNAKVTELLDMGFAQAPSNARVRAPQPPAVAPADVEQEPMIVAGNSDQAPAGAGKTIRVNGLLTTSMRPRGRAGQAATPDLVVADADVIDDAVAAALASATAAAAPAPAEVTDVVAAVVEAEAAPNPAPVPTPVPEPAVVAEEQAIDDVIETAEVEVEPEVAPAPTEIEQPEAVAAATLPAVRPAPRPTNIVTVAATVAPQAAPAISGSEAQPETIAMVAAVAPTLAPTPAPTEATPEIVTRISTSGGRNYGINVGRYGSHYEAERVLMRVALNEMATLDGSLRKVVQGSRGFDANFMGMDRDTAELACRRLQARGTTCFMVGE